MSPGNCPKGSLRKYGYSMPIATITNPIIINIFCIFSLLLFGLIPLSFCREGTIPDLHTEALCYTGYGLALHRMGYILECNIRSLMEPKRMSLQTAVFWISLKMTRLTIILGSLVFRAGKTAQWSLIWCLNTFFRYLTASAVVTFISSRTIHWLRVRWLFPIFAKSSRKFRKR